MANATLEWRPTERFSAQLVAEARSERYRGVDANGNHLYFKDYEVLHLGGQYRFSDNFTVAVRINNLLDQDFTSFNTTWTQNTATGAWTPSHVDDFNNKDKARNYWMSFNVGF